MGYWYCLSIFPHSVSISILQYILGIDTHYFFSVSAKTLVHTLYSFIFSRRLFLQRFKFKWWKVLKSLMSLMCNSFINFDFIYVIIEVATSQYTMMPKGEKFQFLTDFWYLWWRLSRPTCVTFLKTGWWNSKFQASWPHSLLMDHISIKLTIPLPFGLHSHLL